MTRYINADALLEDLNTVNPIYKEMIEWAKRVVEAQPTADVVERKKGEWIKINKYDKESDVQCSVCFEDFDYIDGVCYLCHGFELPLFCPNCGADMRGEKHE